MRFVYSGPFATRDKAESRLEDLFATGAVYESSQPRIERRDGKTASWSKARVSYVITLDE